MMIKKVPSLSLLSRNILCSILLVPSLGFAEGDAEPAATAETNSEEAVAEPWSGNSELGFIQTSGNSDTQSFNGKFNLVHELDPSTTALKLEALSSEEDGESSKEKYVAELKHDYSLSKLSYLASSLTYEDDRFNGYQFQSTLAIGYGYHAWNNKKKGKLDLEVGPGYRRSALEEKNEEGDKVIEEAVARASLNLLLKIGDGAKFTETLTVEGGDSKVVYKSDMGIQSTLIGKLAMKVSHQIKHTTDVPEGKKNTDSLVGVTLVYSF